MPFKFNFDPFFGLDPFDRNLWHRKKFLAFAALAILLQFSALGVAITYIFMVKDFDAKMQAIQAPEEYLASRR